MADVLMIAGKPETIFNARETVRESNAYYIGYMDGQKDEPERGVHGFGSSGR